MTVHARIQLLEDAQAVEYTKFRQMMAFDAMVNDGASSAALKNELSPDFEWRSEEYGSCSGRDQFMTLVATYTRRVSFSLHFLSGSTTRISPDRSHAEGRWVVWQPFTSGGTPWLLAGRFHDELTRHGESWLISASRLKVEILCPWTTGWGDRRISKDWAGQTFSCSD